MIILFWLFSFNIQAADIDGLNILKEKPTCKILKNYLYLSKDQLSLLEKSTFKSMNQRVIRRYKVSCPEEDLVGYLFNDKVRTHYQEVFVLLNKLKIVDVEVTKFEEPHKYRAPKKWLSLMFKNKEVNALKVDAMTGATLTTDSVQRVVKKAGVFNSL